MVMTHSNPLSAAGCENSFDTDSATRAVVDVLAMLHGRIEAALASDGATSEMPVPELVGQVLQNATEVWKCVDRRAFADAEQRLAIVAVDAILALMACRRSMPR